MGVKLDYTPSPANGYDLKDMQIEGNYYLDGTYLNAHTNEAFQGMLNVARYNFTGQKCVQTITTYNNPPRTFRRVLDIAYGGYAYGSPASGGTWSELLVGGQGFSGSITFASAATSNIGEAAKPANNAYLQNAVTVVSDKRQKNDISELTQQELECAIACGKLYRRYKLNKAADEKGNGARFHIGVISQDIVKCFEDHGLDWKQYGVVTYEQWDAIQAVEYIPATYDADHQELTPEIKPVEGRVGGEIYMIRYEELNCFINAGLEYRLTQLEKNTS